MMHCILLVGYEQPFEAYIYFFDTTAYILRILKDDNTLAFY